MALGDHSLSLGGLGKAVGANGDTTSETAISADGRGGLGGAETKLSDFYADKNGSYLSPSSQVFSSPSTVEFTYQFANNGSLFLSRIADRYQNFTWSETCLKFGIETNADYRCDGTGQFSFTTHEGTLIGKFNDSFNYSSDQTQTAAITVT